MMTLIPTESFCKSKWVECDCDCCFMIKDSHPNTLLLGDSIIVCLSKCVGLINALILGIGGDRVQNVPWRAINLSLPSSLKNIVILCGTNNV